MNIAFSSVADLDAPLAGAMLAFDNSFARLPATFYTRLAPTALPDPYLVAASPAAAALVGLGPQDLGREPWLAALAGNRVLPGSDPLAAVYAGHQFGVWSGRLGDGRALLLGERSFSEVARLLEVLSRPYDEQPEFEMYAALPPAWAAQLEVSCSS